MTNTQTKALVNLDAHIRDAFKQYYAEYEVRDIQVDYSGVRFDSQINYLLDQLNGSSWFLVNY